MLKIKKLIFVATFAALVVSGCAQNISPNVYSASQTREVAKVVPGVIVNKRIVKINASNQTGGFAGTVAGAGAGSAIGGSTAGNIVGAVGVGLLGGLVGEAIDNAINTHAGIEYLIRTNQGKMISIVQSKELEFQLHQRIFVIFSKPPRIVAQVHCHSVKL